MLSSQEEGVDVLHMCRYIGFKDLGSNVLFLARKEVLFRSQ